MQPDFGSGLRLGDRAWIAHIEAAQEETDAAIALVSTEKLSRSGALVRMSRKWKLKITNAGPRNSRTTTISGACRCAG